MEQIGSYYNRIIRWLEDYHKNQPDINTYRGFEYSPEFAKDVKNAKKSGVEFSIDPMLPIDLLAVKKTREIDDKTRKSKSFNYYILFWFIPIYDLNLEKKLQFYRFYLSRISKLKGVDIIIVIPSDTKRSLENALRKNAELNGFGLWRINLTQEDPKVLCEPKDFREQMESTFQKPPKGMKTFNKDIRKQADEIALFFESFVREAIEAMVGISPKQVGKRYIERKVLDLVFELDNISYAGRLCKLVTQHLVQKDNDYDFVSKVFDNLWKACKFKMNYSKFLEDSELPLYNIFPRAKQEKPYRDHYLHQFQVFILGLYIIDKLGHKFPSSESNNIEKKWLISSSFHDMAYPIQFYDSWAKTFFNESLGIPEIGVTDIKSHFVEKTLLSCMGDIINLLCKLHRDGELRGNWLSKEKKLICFFHEKITNVKHHCILSSIILLKQFVESKAPSSLNDLFVSSALAIALHHEEVWKELSDKHGLSELRFENDPLSFLLLFCDAAQEWGRPKKEYSDEIKIEEEKSFFLKKLKVTKSKCLVTIKAPGLLVTDPIFDRKITELRMLQHFLHPPADIEFQITLIDKSNTKQEYPMIGLKK